MKQTWMTAVTALMIIFVSCWALAADPAPDNAGVETSALSSFLQSKTQEMETLQLDAQALQERAEQLSTSFAPAMERTRNGLKMLEVMARMVKTNPYDMRVALAEAKYWQLSLAKEYLPLENLTKELDLKIETIQTLQDDLERKWSTSLDTHLRHDVQAIHKNVGTLRTSFREMQKQLSATAAQVTEVQARLTEWVTAFETQLPQIWKAEFLDGRKFRLFPADGVDVHKEIADWYGNVKTFLTNRYTWSPGETGDWIGTFFFFWLPFMLVGVFSYRFLASVFTNANAGGRLTSGFGIVCLSLALSLLAAFLSGGVKQTSVLLFATHVLMLLGVQALAWVFRNVRGVLKHKAHQPLLPVVFLSSSVALIDLLRLPGWLENQIWISLLVLSSLFFGMVQPELRYERAVRSIHPYILAVLVAVAVLGWGNLAGLASMLWGVLALGMQWALGATSVLRVTVEKARATGLRALLADMAVTFFTLLIWTGVGIGIMTWIGINLGTNAVGEKLSSLELNWGDFSFNFVRLGVVILLFQVARSLALAWKAVLDDEHMRWKGIDHGAAASLQRIGIYCLWLLYGLVSLNLLGISLTNFAVIAGGLSVGIGFGMQTIISNFISGLILLFDRALRPGDIIEVGGLWARVMSVNIRNTEVQTFDNAKIFVPNSALISGQLVNWTHRNDMHIRRDVSVGVAYGSDVQVVKKLLAEAAAEHPAVLSNPAPAVLFNNFSPSSLDFVLRVWIRHVDLALSTCSELREAIDAKFKEAGVELAFPQMDIHIRPSDGVIRIVRAEHGEKRA